MFKKILIFFGAFLFGALLFGCQSVSTTAPQTETTTTIPTTQTTTLTDGYALADTPQEGTILHAWNWSMSTVEAHLEDIAIAGFTSVQVSPMQPQKDYFGIASWGSTWWKLYQPLGFVIATQNHSIGTKDDLQSLCEAADTYGIKIIVDVVANHLAGGDSQTLNAAVQDYESVIYDDDLIHTNNGMASDSSIASVVRGALGDFPDLQTENPIVQNRVLDLLKAYVDVGVDGFRFDAAKHIETPEDGAYASDFWPTVIHGVETYAQTLGRSLYFYGEILNTAGTDRSYLEYTDYMSVTANTVSDQIRNGVTGKDASRLTNYNYPDGVNPNLSVLWAESHDDFASGHTNNILDDYITKAYVVDASMKGATSLYFVRPGANTLMGECGSYLWQSIEVSSINRFHTYFTNADQTISNVNGLFVNERYTSTRQGVVLVDISGQADVTDVPVSHLPDGTYKDQVSGTDFIVQNGKINGTLGASGIAVVYNNPYTPRPVVYMSDDGSHGTFSDTLNVTIYSYNTTEATYSINGGDPVTFSGDTVVELSSPDANATVTLDIDAWYGDYKITKHYEYVKSNTVVTEVVVNNLSANVTSGYKMVAWAWKQGQEGQWVDGVLDGDTFTFTLPPGDTFFLLVIFPSGTISYDWSSKVMQTNDAEVPGDGIYDGSTLTWN